jgi:hypothetical protein
MITVSILSGRQNPLEEGITFDLVSIKDGIPEVISSAKTDAAGVVTFDFDAPSVGEFAIRLDAELLDEMRPGS